MASTSCMRTAISPEQRQPWTAVSSLLGLIRQRAGLQRIPSSLLPRRVQSTSLSAGSTINIASCWLGTGKTVLPRHAYGKVVMAIPHAYGRMVMAIPRVGVLVCHLLHCLFTLWPVHQCNKWLGGSLTGLTPLGLFMQFRVISRCILCFLERLCQFKNILRRYDVSEFRYACLGEKTMTMYDAPAFASIM